MKPIRINLLVKILIAIVLGIAAGNFFPVWAGRIFMTFNAIFGQFLGFLIPLIILGFVAPAIAEIGKNAGKMLVWTALIAYAATLMSGFLSYGVGESVFPHLISPDNLKGITEGNDLQPYFTIEMPPLMGVMTALVTAFTVGICLSQMQGEVLRSASLSFVR